MTTLEQLRHQFASPSPTLGEVMAAYFPHISSKKYFLQEVTAGRITLRVSKDPANRKARHFVHLADLATWLDAQAPSNTTAADQAA